jgi:hypothetical protein
MRDGQIPSQIKLLTNDLGNDFEVRHLTNLKEIKNQMKWLSVSNMIEETYEFNF